MYKENHVRPVTLRKYRMDAKWLRLNASKMRLSDVENNRMVLQWLINQYGKNHQKATVLDFKGHLFAALRSAVDDDLLKKVPLSQIEIHSVEQNWTVEQKNAKRTEVKALDASEYRIVKTRLYIDLEDELKQAPIRATKHSKLFKNKANVCVSDQTKLMLLSVLFHTGCRFSEALGITKEDVHPNSIMINKTWDYKTNTGFQKTKNDASIRDVAVDENIIKQLNNFIAWKQEHFGDAAKTLPLLVEPKTRTYNDTYNHFFKSLLKKYEIGKDLSVHKIRHTYISYLLNEGVSAESIARQVGHSDTSMIQKVYGHLLAERAAEDNLRIRSLLR